ncbi:MAG TPA: GNAT family N-acetyltransferase [Gaiellaceae bacterium]|jgi:L-amino acid N-acyltransferase YncA
MLRLADRIAPGPVEVRPELRELRPDDWPAVSRIYWNGIRSGLASFETELPAWEAWDAAHLTGHRLVATVFDQVVGWAALSPVSARHCYRGVVENSVYVTEDHQGRGIGRLLLEGLVRLSERDGIWTIQTSIFPENRASIALHIRCGFRIVGVRERIARRDGIWRDTLLLERRNENM